MIGVTSFNHPKHSHEINKITLKQINKEILSEQRRL